jgi:hypothetical protein
MASTRQIDSFEYSVCGATLESWNTAWAPTYRLIAGPVWTPEQSPDCELNCSKSLGEQFSRSIVLKSGDQ